MTRTTPHTTDKLRCAGWYLAGVFAVAIAYYATARVGLLFSVEGTHVAFIWPPTGIAVAVLSRAGRKFFPGIFLGAIACEFQLFPWWVALCVSAGNAVGPLIAVEILRRFRFNPTSAGRRDLYAFLLAGLVGMTATATNGALWRMLGGLPPIELVPAWLVWWLGDTAGLLIVAPPLLTAVRPRMNRSAIRPTLVLLLTTVLCGIAFTNAAAAPVRSLMVFPPFMLLIWVGMNERLRVGSLHVLILAAFAVAGTSEGVGAFGHLAPMTKMLMVWALAITAALITLAMTTTLAERERAEAALTTAAREYQNLVDSTPAAIVRYTPEGKLTFVNETLCRLLGYPRDLLIGQSVMEFIPEMPREEMVADLPVPQPITGPASGASGMIRKPDGSCLWYRWTARHITTGDGRSEIQAVGIDLTERRLAEAERTALERKMQDTQRLEALGVLAGGVAHDFNNLLAGIHGHAELAAGLLPEGHPARDHLATVLSGVAQAGGLTRQLLAYSGKGRFLLRTIDLNELISQTTELLRVTLPKKVQLNLHLSPTLPLITGDDGQLRQVLMNLLINAGEAIGDRAGTVTVTTTAHDLALEAVSGGVYSPAAPGQFIELIVSDTGCGMDDATKARLFDPFFTTKFTGRGLGMSAVLGIIRGHGGGIRVDSRAGFGTRFTVLLPVTTEALPEAVTTPAPMDPLLRTPLESPPRHRRGRRTESIPRPQPRATPAPDPRPAPAAVAEARGLALVADDEPIVRQVGELMLKQMGYEVLTACNGAEAVALFVAHADLVRVVLLDLMMPVMDGAEALAAIRDRSTVPVILCSGYTAEAVPEDLASDSATGFLQKPYARGDLQSALAAIGA
ncbi:response regulator [Gemmata sp. G18]|uniref:histidine kinase n=1 Tax=Gemmata palustris TaxID=2822762 RepID=A0ABS5BUM3_9BACT|nr:response regulator [Gemmata palustris]MBP3956593.1 response regulator [Gemmata palustris]